MYNTMKSYIYNFSLLKKVGMKWNLIILRIIISDKYKDHPESKFLTARIKEQNVITWKDLLQKIRQYFNTCHTVGYICVV